MEAAAGLLLGAVVGLLVERLRWRREDRVRWRHERRDAYQAFLVATEEWQRLDYILAMELGLEENDGLDWEHAAYVVANGDSATAQLRVRVGSAAERVSQTLTGVELVGSEPTVSAAKAFWACCQQHSNVARQFPPRHCGGAHEDLVRLGEELDWVRTSFVEAVRRELQVPS